MIALSVMEILQRLVAFPTVSRDTNLPLIDWVRNYLANCGIESHRVFDATGQKSNLFATIGPPVEGGLVLSGHTDVVPIDGQAWSSDPFTLTERDDRLHARGACDMKGFIAAALGRVPAWADMSLTRPVHLMFSYDEEVGCLGAPSMIAAAQKVLPTPAAVIVGEPTGMRIATQHKGICTLHTRVSGIEAHSSLTHRGVSAVMLAAELVAHLRGVAGHLAREPQVHAAHFEPPYTTLSVNRISGGTAINILAAVCDFDWDIRSLSAQAPCAILEELAVFAERQLAALRAEGKSCTVDTRMQADVPALEGAGGIAEALARSAGASTETTTVPFATEGGQFQRAGWSTVVCGPGSIEQAHKPDEYIERAELTACGAFLDRLIDQRCR